MIDEIWQLIGASAPTSWPQSFALRFLKLFGDLAVPPLRQLRICQTSLAWTMANMGERLSITVKTKLF